MKALQAEAKSSLRTAASTTGRRSHGRPTTEGGAGRGGAIVA